MPRELTVDRSKAVQDDKLLSRGFNGAHYVGFTEFVTTLDSQNKEYLDIRVKDVETGKEYSLQRQYLDTNPNKEGTSNETYRRKIFRSLVALLGVSKLEVALRPAKVWNSETKEFEMKPVEQYVNLIGKKVGAVLIHKEEYQNKFINLYTGETVEPTEALKRNPEYGYVPDLDKPRVSIFDVLMFFDWNTKLSLSELEAGEKKPSAVLKKIKQAENTANDELNIHSYEQKRLDTLKKRLSSAGQKFDESRYLKVQGAEPYSDKLF